MPRRQYHLDQLELTLMPPTPERPRVRADCDRARARNDGTQGPCPFISCHHHLLEITGSRDPRVLLSQGRLTTEDEILERLETMSETCALDVAERRGACRSRVADAFGLTYESVRQTEHEALRKVRKALRVVGAYDD